MIEVLKFFADWCGPCHAINPIIDQLESEYKGKIEVKKVDVDKEPEVAEKMGVLSIPTLIFRKDGKEYDRIVGLTTKEAIKSKLEPQLV